MMKNRRWIGRTALLVSVLATGHSSIANAQEPEVKMVSAAAHRCSCGRWTCPICQQRRLKETCPPGQVVPILPGQMMPGQMMPGQMMPGQMPSDVPSMPSPSDSPGGAQFRLDDSTPTPLPGGLDQANIGNATDQLNAADAGGLDRVGRSSDTSGLFASNTGGLADPGLFGDFFGPTSNANSIISQNYVFENVPGSFNGSGYDFDLASTQSTNDFTAVDSSGQLILLPPSTSDDVVRPGAPGWRYGQGTATETAYGLYRLQYSFLRDITVPSSFAQQRMKLAENTSPIPQNRIFVNYSLFQNVPLENGINVNRISPGFETLLFSPNTSFEMRTPFATTLSSDILAEGGTNTNQVEFGNMFFSLKQVILRRNRAVVSTGMSMTVPTAESTRIFSAGQEIIRVENQSVHLMPFLGGIYKPSARTFMQGVLQVDIDANGNTVKSNQNFNSPGLSTIGRLQDLTLLYVDTGVGFWAYRSTGRGLTGVAPLIEGHYNRSLNSADCVIDAANGTRIQLPIQQFDNINIVAATVFEFNNRSRLGIGYGAPLGNGSDRAFDGEFRATFNRYY